MFLCCSMFYCKEIFKLNIIFLDWVKSLKRVLNGSMGCYICGIIFIIFGVGKNCYDRIVSIYNIIM